MRKFLISVLVILLIVLAYFIIMGKITIFDWQNINIGDIQDLNKNLDSKINVAKDLNNQQYPESIVSVETSIEDLKIVKERYLAKTAYLAENLELGVTTIKQFRIEKLWITLQNYAKKEKVYLELDVSDNNKLDFTVIGEYISITDFIYDIENDDMLSFKIKDFVLVPVSRR